MKTGATTIKLKELGPGRQFWLVDEGLLITLDIGDCGTVFTDEDGYMSCLLVRNPNAVFWVHEDTQVNVLVLDKWIV